MKLEKIIIKGLFGKYDREIDLSDRVCILMGENGVGKTTILKLIDAVYNYKYFDLLELPYNEICLSFEEEELSVVRQDSKEDVKLKYTLNRYSIFEHSITLGDVQSCIPSYLRRISNDTWEHVENRRELSWEIVSERYRGRLKGILPEWLNNHIENFRVSMISTQRLFSNSRNLFGRARQNTVNKCAENMRDKIYEIKREAGGIADGLDKTFPHRLLNINKTEKTQEELKNALKQVTNVRNSLTNLGLLEKSEDVKIRSYKSLEEDDTMRNVLSLYIEDSINKLQVYEEFAQKLKVFVNIINSRFRDKIIYINMEHGLSVKPDFGIDDIPLEQLSSGEQNELVIFYNMIFNGDDKHLILLDEPEISLHLKWLNRMLHDLLEATEKSQTKLLIATHSPDFVGDQYQLVQNLE